MVRIENMHLKVVQNHKMASFESQNINKIDVFEPQIWLKLTFCRFFERLEIFQSNTPELKLFVCTHFKSYVISVYCLNSSNSSNSYSSYQVKKKR